MMKLYYKKGACSMTPHTALQWTGQPFEAQNMTPEALKAPDFLALNPQGAVPLLVDGDLALSQNVAIVQYLDARFPAARIFGSDTPEGKARAWRWLAFLNADVHKAFVPLFRPPEWTQDEGVKKAMQQAARESIVRMLGQCDAHLAKQPFLGETISVADVYLYVILRWCASLGLDLGSLTHLPDFKERVVANPGVQAVLAREGLQP